MATKLNDDENPMEGFIPLRAITAITPSLCARAGSYSTNYSEPLYSVCRVLRFLELIKRSSQWPASVNPYTLWPE